MATGPAWRSDLGSPSSLSEVASDPTHDQRIGPRRGKADNNRGPRGSLNGWLHAGGSHDVQSRITYAAHLQDEYPTATVPAAHRSALDGGVHTRLLEVSPMLPRVRVQQTANHLLVGNLGARGVALEEIHAPFA